MAVAKVARPKAKGARAIGLPKAARVADPPADLGGALILAFLTNERINQVLLDFIDAGIWRESPPCSQRRNIATSFAHMHNVRCMRLCRCRRNRRRRNPP